MVAKYSKKTSIKTRTKKTFEEVFIEEFNELSPKQRERLITKLNYELGLIGLQIEDLKDSLPEFIKYKELDEGDKLLISMGSILAFMGTGIAVGASMDSPEAAIGGACLGALIGLFAGTGITEGIQNRSIRNFFKEIKYKRILKKIEKLETKQLKLAKKLDAVSTLTSKDPKSEKQEKDVAQRKNDIEIIK